MSLDGDEATIIIWINHLRATDVDSFSANLTTAKTIYYYYYQIDVAAATVAVGSLYPCPRVYRVPNLILNVNSIVRTNWMPQQIVLLMHFAELETII